MGLYQQFLGLVAMGAAGSPGQEALPNPFHLGWDQLLLGNPLAQYTELRKRESDFFQGVTLAEAYSGLLTTEAGAYARNYAECRATVEGNLGRIQDSLRTQSVGDYRPPVQAPYLDSPLDTMRRQDAISYLLKGADRHGWLMLGEEHMKPQSRSLLIPLLRGLHKKGFRYFAAETFARNMEPAMRRGYLTWSDGVYTCDPVFAAAAREAIRLGFKLVPYDDTELPTQTPPNDPMFRANFREHAQAERLKERILDRDPKAKVLVWGGRGHVSEQAGKFPDGNELRPMAYEFRRLTGIDPLTAYLPAMMEGASSAYESAAYKYATQKGWVNEPTVFVGKTSFAVGNSDVSIFFPRTRYVHGRPDWLPRLLDRVPVPIPPELAKTKSMLLAQAWPKGEPVTAVPIDQILLMPGDPLPALMLPRRGQFQIRVIDPTGKAVGQTELRTS